MSSKVLEISRSLDGFVAGPSERLDNGLRDGGARLHEGAGAEGVDGVERLNRADREVLDEVLPTGSALAGRGTLEPAGGWHGDPHDGHESTQLGFRVRR